MKRVIYIEGVDASEKSLDMFIDVLLKSTEAYIEGTQKVTTGLGTFKELMAGCEVKQAECQKDNSEAIKIMEVYNPTTIADVLKKFLELGNDVVEFYSKSYNTASSVKVTRDKIMSSISDLEKSFEASISMKEEMRTAVICNNLLDLIDLLEGMFSKDKKRKAGNIFYMMEECFDELMKAARYVDASRESDTDEDIDEKELVVSHRKLLYGKEIVSKYKAIGIKIFGKYYTNALAIINSWTS